MSELNILGIELNESEYLKVNAAATQMYNGIIWGNLSNVEKKSIIHKIIGR